MAITENQARRILLVRSIEQASNNGGIWTTHDAKAATLATNSMTREKSAFDLFLARRAELVIEKITKQNSGVVIELSKQHPLTLLGWILIVTAFATGLITDHLMADRWVNIIEWPIVLLICWNLGFVTYIVAIYFLSLFRHKMQSKSSWCTDILGRWQLWGIRSFTSRKKTQAWIKTFESQWCKNCISLNNKRISLVFHAASIAFSIGALASLYMRGLFKEYRAGWESTFISADTIHAIARFVLAPGAWLFNINIPDAEHIAGLQTSNGIGELAGEWIHLYAGSILVCVILPRLVLLAITGYSKSSIQRNFPLALSSIYYTALKSVRAGYKAAVLTIPFRYELTAAMKSNLTMLLERSHGLSSSVTLEQSVVMGNDSDDWKSALHHEGYIAVFVIFNLAATAEEDTHGRVMQRISKESKALVPVIPIVDTSAYTDQSPDRCDDRNKLRFSQRCDQWRQILDAVGCTPLFLNLLTVDQQDAQESVEARLYAYN